MQEREGTRGIEKLHYEINKRLDFITKYHEIGESHMVEFFVSDHWNKQVHSFVQEHLMKFEEEDLYTLQECVFAMESPQTVVADSDHAVSNLEKYLKEAEDCKIMNSGVCLSVSELEQHIPQMKILNNSSEDDTSELMSTKEYMCAKKSHEVDKMSDIIKTISDHLCIKDVLDIGSGKGYLGSYLSMRYGLNVFGVDCSESNSFAASTRAKKYAKYWNAHLHNKKVQDLVKEKRKLGDQNFHPVTAFVDGKTDIKTLISAYKERYDIEGQFKPQESQYVILTGLHSCGNLSSTALRAFCGVPDVKAICVVGCCYHFLTEPDSQGKEVTGFPMSEFLKAKNTSLGRNKLLLGLKAPERIKSTSSKEIEAKSTRSLFYRSVLSVILKNEFDIDPTRKDIRVGKVYEKSKSFVDYVQKCIRKLKLDDQSSSLTTSKITSYLEMFQGKRKQLVGYNFLRDLFAPAVESLILLDKLLYLKEQDESSSFLVQLFDPVKSPRCYALIGIKPTDIPC